MRILLLNPNTSREVTALMAEAARAASSPGTVIVEATAPRGVPYISNQAEAQIGGAIALEMLAEAGDEVDGAVIAAFGDPGLAGARELFPRPVVGLAEAAMLTACMVGRRFGIVTFTPALLPWYRDCVAQHGLLARCAGLRAVDERFRDLATIAGEKEEALVALAGRMVAEDGADVLIFAGAPLSGLARTVADRLPVPAVEQVGAAIRQAETLVALGMRPGPGLPPKSSSGLTDALAAAIAGTRRSGS